tara:strand:- start:5062 stop:5976 length:915 start_codon:yes stop_codon:yes gene_type:complete
MYAKIILDSINEAGQRIVTLEVEHPTYIDAQINKHRVISKNTQSQRAVPFSKFCDIPLFIPKKVGRWSKGMESHTYFEGEAHQEFVRLWTKLEQTVIGELKMMNKHFKDRYQVGIAKEVINRPLSAFRTSKSIMTGMCDEKGWNNFFRLRSASDAQSCIYQLSEMIKGAIDGNTPVFRKWHLPYSEALSLEERIIQSVTTCAKISYRKGSVRVARSLFLRLSESGHWSPFEHQVVDIAQCNTKIKPTVDLTGNYLDTNWVQLRKLLDKHTNKRTDLEWQDLYSMDFGVDIERLQQADSVDEDNT